MDKNIQQQLDACNSIADMFAVLEKNYDLKSCKPGAITKPIFIKGILAGIKLVNPTEK
jgi:hypothetical protein